MLSHSHVKSAIPLHLPENRRTHHGLRKHNNVISFCYVVLRVGDTIGLDRIRALYSLSLFSLSLSPSLALVFFLSVT